MYLTYKDNAILKKYIIRQMMEIYYTFKTMRIKKEEKKVRKQTIECFFKKIIWTKTKNTSIIQKQ